MLTKKKSPLFQAPHKRKCMFSM